MDRLRQKIQEAKKCIDSYLDDLLEMEEDNVHHMIRHLDRSHHKLFELSREVERVIQESFK